MISGKGEALHWQLTRGRDQWQGMPNELLAANS